MKRGSILSLGVAATCLILVTAGGWWERAVGSAAGEPETWVFHLVDEEGKPTAARVCAWTSDGDALVPGGAMSWVMANQPGRFRGAEFFYSDGQFELTADTDIVRLYVRKGLEYHFLEREVPRGKGPTTLTLRRAIDMKARGYYSGDGHIHPVGGEPDWARLPGRTSFYREEQITNQLLRTIVDATDLNYANLLSSNSLGDEVHFRDRVIGENEPESDDHRILRVSEEYRSEVYGHMSVFGSVEPSDPVFTALIGSEEYPYDYPTNLDACLKYEADGAFPCFAHLRRQPNIALECPVDVALGALHAIELQGYAVGTRGVSLLWEMLLNCGFRVVVTAGTDATLTSVSGLPPGGARVYVDMDGLPFTHRNWLDQLAKGRSFTTKGAMLFLTVDGKKPGQTIDLDPGDSRDVTVRVEVESLFPWETIEIRRNGETVLEFDSADDSPFAQQFEAELTLDGPAWIYAHLGGELGDHALGGTNPWWVPTLDAYTNPIWVEVPGQGVRDRESLEFMIDWVQDNRKALEQRDNYGSESNREEVLATIEEALAVYNTRLGDAEGPER